jgi:hypothetical protein
VTPAAPSLRPAGLAALWGRTFLHPALDYLLIGGGLSLLATALLAGAPRSAALVDPLALAWLLLVSNMAHFASSTVRLYTRPGAARSWPFLTLALPLVTLAVLSLCIARPDGLGLQLQRLYLTWSPYHYAAQAYGLAVMYSLRSGCHLAAADRRWLRVASLLPFLWVFLEAREFGLGWLLPPEARAALPAGLLAGVGELLRVLAFAAPLALFLKLRRGADAPMPLIAPLILLVNGVWWFVLPELHAFVWATIFHGIQYLAIVLVFHVRERMALPDNRHGGLYHALSFYGLSLLLGYALFRILPQAYMGLGFGAVESLLLVTAMINVHHFVVDAYIWRVRRDGSNRRIVEASPAPA